MTCDTAEGRSTEAELNDALSLTAWGTVDPESSDWTLESEEPTLESPHPSLISYAEFCARAFPVDDDMDEEVRSENALMAAEKRTIFTNAGEPGFKFRPMLEQMVKCLEFQSKALKKAFNINKAILNEGDMPEDSSKTEAQNMVRFGRHQVIPAFWQLLIHLAKSNRRFSVVFRAFSEDQLGVAQQELSHFCQMTHPSYDGKNKTTKPPLMNGDKGSRDMRLHDTAVGRLDRQSGRLEFSNRQSGENPAPEGDAVAEAAPAGEEAAAQEAPQAEFQPTVYGFPPYHECYAGLMNHILGPGGANTAAILEDHQHWEASGRKPEAGKLLLVDHAGGFAETQVQHIFFDGHIGSTDSGAIDVRDVVSGEPVPFAQAKDVFLHRVDFFQAIVDDQYFVRAVEECELNMSKGIIESRKVDSGEEQLPADAVAALPPKEWLHHNIIPALLPALESCQRLRPADPIEYIAFYMLRHGKQYSKTVQP
jgi:hypothetical protein